LVELQVLKNKNVWRVYFCLSVFGQAIRCAVETSGFKQRRRRPGKITLLSGLHKCIYRILTKLIPSVKGPSDVLETTRRNRSRCCR
jgi:hypothetical protein